MTSNDDHERLRKAAKVLRELAQAADAVQPRETWSDQALDYLGAEWGEYVATMHPGVGVALADWLDDHASLGESWDSTRRGNGVQYVYDPTALRIADLILGRESS